MKFLAQSPMLTSDTGLKSDLRNTCPGLPNVIDGPSGENSVFEMMKKHRTERKRVRIRTKKKFSGYKIVAMTPTSFCVLQDLNSAVTVSKNKHRGAIWIHRRTMCSRCKCLLSCILYMFKGNKLAPNTCVGSKMP